MMAEERNKDGTTKDSVTHDHEANIVSSKAKSQILDPFKPKAVLSKMMDDRTGDKQS